MKKNVLYITNDGGMYGANQSLIDMLYNLKKENGVNPYVIINGNIGYTGELGSRLDELDIPFFVVPFRAIAIPLCTRFFSCRRITKPIMRYVDLINLYRCVVKKKMKVDIIHTNTSIIDIGYLLSRWLCIPHVWHIREFGQEDYELTNILRSNVYRNELKKSRCIAISKAVSDSFKKKYNTSCYQIYNDIRIPDTYDKEFLYNNIINFSVVGAVKKGKGQMDVLRAIALIKNREYYDFKVYIYGDIDSELKPVINDLINSYGINENVILNDFDINIEEKLKFMDVGIMASKSEAFGRVTVEYLANYMQVIGTTTGGTPEVLDGLGMLYEPGDVDTLAKHMMYCIDHRDKLAIGKDERRARAEFFAQGECARKVAEIYNEL